MREGDYYPDLRYVRIVPHTLEIMEKLSTPKDWLDNQSQYMINKRTVAGLQITMPEADWEAIMEIYRAHFHAENRNPGVRDAWEQYQIMCALTR